MKKLIIIFLCLLYSVSIHTRELTFVEILEGLYEVRYDRFSGYDGFDWMVRTYDKHKIVVIYFDSTTEYLDFRADFSAVISRFFQRSHSQAHRQENRQKQIDKILSIKNEDQKLKKLEEYQQVLKNELLSDSYFSLSSQNHILNSQLHQAWLLFLDVLMEKNYDNYRILMVGHSFGALLAQATASRALTLNWLSKLNREIYAVTFSALGANGAVKNYLPKNYLDQYIYTFNRKEDLIVHIAWGGSLGKEFWWPEYHQKPSKQNKYAFFIERLLGNHHLIPIILDLENDKLPHADIFPWMNEKIE